ncbi:MAG: rhodanese-like domain-containing protein [Deltaproteobacteria bacterium]|nr:rhodanese-like domain-containing protein [Deltaproteobacteria bacterium]
MAVNRTYIPSILVALLSVCLLFTGSLMAQDVSLMNIDELKELLNDPNVVIIDVRTNSDWQESTYKIQGALREEKSIFDSWADKYPKDKTFVLYCA